jgi:hypothetical protein
MNERIIVSTMQAIYPDEFEDISGCEPYHYKIHLLPNPGQDEDNHGDY